MKGKNGQESKTIKSMKIIKGRNGAQGIQGTKDMRDSEKIGSGWGNMVTLALLAFLLLLFVSVPAWAAGAEGSGVNPGVRIGQWIQYNVAALFAPLIGLVALYYLLRRQFTKFLAFACFAVLVAVFIFAGNDFKDAAVSLGRWIIGR